MTQTQAVALATQKANTIRSLLSRDDVKKQLGMAIPRHLSVDRLLRVAMTSIQRNNKLLDCTPQSLLSCVMTCAQLGIEPDAFLGQAYLVPFWNGKKNQFEAQLMPGYRGYIALARRSGEVQSVQAQVVYEKDQFDLKYGLHETLDHVPADGDRGSPKGAYVIFRYKDNSYSFDYMSAADIEKIRSRSKSPEDGPWVTDWDEMAKKTVIKRHAKLAPMSVEFQRASALEDRAHSGESQMDILTEGLNNGRGDAITVEQGDEVIDAPSVSFDELYLIADKQQVTKAEMATFLEVTAKSNGMTVDRLKHLAAQRFDEFWGSFEAWRAKGTVPKRGRKPKVKEAEPVQASEPKDDQDFTPVMVDCPDGAEIQKTFCDSECSRRDGCPALE